MTHKVKTTKGLKNTRAIRVHQKHRMKNLFDFSFFFNFGNLKPTWSLTKVFI